MDIFKKTKLEPEKPPYLDRIDELPKLNIVRLKGKIEQNMIPVIDARIAENRRQGSKIDKNVLLDYAQVIDVDSSTIAFHFNHLKEYEDKGFKIGFINPNPEMKILLTMFKEGKSFKVYSSEEEAVADLNE